MAERTVATEGPPPPLDARALVVAGEAQPAAHSMDGMHEVRDSRPAASGDTQEVDGEDAVHREGQQDAASEPPSPSAARDDVDDEMMSHVTRAGGLRWLAALCRWRPCMRTSAPASANPLPPPRALSGVLRKSRVGCGIQRPRQPAGVASQARASSQIAFRECPRPREVLFSGQLRVGCRIKRHRPRGGHRGDGAFARAFGLLFARLPWPVVAPSSTRGPASPS